jgi:TPR repeat protein
MIRNFFCALAVLVGLTLPALAEEPGDLQAIRARQLYIEGNHDAAFAAIKPLAEQGVPRAEVILGFFYERGIGTPVDEALAVEWYHKAADHGQPAGLHNLAYSYENGELGLPLDMAKAYELYLKAVAVEYAPSIHNLARMHIYGTAPEPDAALGRALIERAVSLGLPEATAEYGYMLATGDGLPVDLKRARELYFAAAAQGVDWAQRDYGEMLELGEGGAIDLEAAEEWYRAAQRQGYVMAGYDIAEMIWANPTVFPDRAVEALAWCLWAEANGPGEGGEDYTGNCADPAAKLTPEDLAKAEELAATF